MISAPLKYKYCERCKAFHFNDVAAAVEWLKLKISHIGFSYELIDKAFEDVVKK